MNGFATNLDDVYASSVRSGKKAFSAVLGSMVPETFLGTLQAESVRSLIQFDEFGFKINKEDSDSDETDKSPDNHYENVFTEDEKLRLQWIAYFEFTFNKSVQDLTWEKVEAYLPKSDQLQKLVLAGVPHSMRPYVWSRLCGASLKQQEARVSYGELQKTLSGYRSVFTRQIEKDLFRIMPYNGCFSGSDSTGVRRLRQVLYAISYLYPEIGYCQGLGVIVGTLLLFMEEESVLWMMCTIIEDILPPHYFTENLFGVQADQQVLRQLIAELLPDIDRLLVKHDIEVPLITMNWFLTLFSAALDIRLLLRFWDLLFYQGSSALFQLALSMLQCNQQQLLAATNSADLFNMLAALPSELYDTNELLTACLALADRLNETTFAVYRRKQLDKLICEGYQFSSTVSSCSEDSRRNGKSFYYHQQRRLKPVGGSRSLLKALPFSRRLHSTSGASAGSAFVPPQSPGDTREMKLKNVNQTEILLKFKNSINCIALYFKSCDSLHYQNVDVQADYSTKSHAEDYSRYLASQRNQNRKRARAIFDFESREEDELGFRRNDIITIISRKDEHCWVGELNGLRGWFPAKFVEILDERSKQYTFYGDDAIAEEINHLVRGSFCQSLKTVFEYGLTKHDLLNRPLHPWLFIDEVAKDQVRKDFHSIYSRLVLCKTFKLDEDAKVLTPEETLFNCVQFINYTHDLCSASPDVKLRTLVCLGLNEQALHLWFEIFCSSQEIVEKWYAPCSFVRSPAWVQIKCDLRVLSQFSFNLSADAELSPRFQRQVDQPLKESVREMLVKHHLFSWEL